MDTFKTDQERFWAGQFGDEYINRNPIDMEMSGRLALFAKILAQTNRVQSIIEFGCNIGNNLKAINRLFPGTDLSAVEINNMAVESLREWGKATVYHQSILEFQPEKSYDFSFVSGVLIHINPEMLPRVYKLLAAASSRYICVIEYYNPTPVEIPYRGHSGKLFKRDFAGEMLDAYPDLKLIDYGFVYHRDNNFPLDDLTWFLLEQVS